MSDDYAVLSTEDLPTLRKLSALLETLTSDMDDDLHRSVLRYAFDFIDALKSKVEGAPDSSPQPRGDRAANPFPVAARPNHPPTETPAKENHSGHP